MQEPIALSGSSLASLLHAAYCDEDPQRFIEHLLRPYFVTPEQVQQLASGLYWPGRPHASHPLYATVREIRGLQCGARNAENKEWFIRVATSVSHVFHSPLKAANETKITAYQGENDRLPYCWLEIDAHGMVDECARSSDMPALAITVYRSLASGHLMPFEVEVDGKGVAGCSYIHLHIDHLRGLTLEAHSAEPRELRNYALFFSHSQPVGEIEMRAFLVSPSLGRVWTLPFLSHPPAAADELGNNTSPQ